jgi:hypothetical protein
MGVFSQQDYVPMTAKALLASISREGARDPAAALVLMAIVNGLRSATKTYRGRVWTLVEPDFLDVEVPLGNKELVRCLNHLVWRRLIDVRNFSDGSEEFELKTWCMATLTAKGRDKMSPKTFANFFKQVEEERALNASK